MTDKPIAPASPAASLPEEHALLRDEVASRAERVLREADEDRWPARELTALVNYLQLEVLRQLVDEEWLLFRSAREAASDLMRLRSDHFQLRLTVDTLTQAAASSDAMTTAQLAAAVRELLTQLDAHLAAEERTLAVADAAAPSTASRGAQPHEWFSLVEGSAIDLDQLPGPHGADAVLDRLLRLRPGERVEVHASADLSPLWQRLRRADPGGWGVTNLDTGPPRWRVEIVRRPPEPGLTPAAG